MEKYRKTKWWRISWKGKFLNSWVLEHFFCCCCFLFCFVFEKTSSSLPILIAHVGKRPRGTLRSSRSQIFFKVGVFKNFSIFAIKRLCWSPLLINLQHWRPALLLKKRFQHKCFPWVLWSFYKQVSSWTLSLFIILFRNFTWWWNSLNVFGWKSDVFYISCTIAFLHNSNVRIESPCLFRTCFHTKIFARIPTSAPAIFWLNH